MAWGHAGWCAGDALSWPRVPRLACRSMRRPTHRRDALPTSACWPRLVGGDAAQLFATGQGRDRGLSLLAAGEEEATEEEDDPAAHQPRRRRRGRCGRRSDREDGHRRLEANTEPREKIEGTPPELRQGLFTSRPGTPSPDPKPWSAFPDDPKPQAAVKSAHPRSVRTLRASNSNKASSLGQPNANSGADPFAFGQDSFKAAPSGTVLPKLSNMRNTTQPLNQNAEEKKDGSYQPAGWTGF